ncbi:MAG TPA: dethiobiotin synthase [Puia sp.]|nr:dethiobiotin synthase [Puia sp.]
MKPIFITGIGTGVGKTMIAAMVTEALGAWYWKPVQAGFDEGTDAEWVGARISDKGRILPEAYKLRLPASPHIAAREEGAVISLDSLAEKLPAQRPLVVEGAGGLFVPLNDTEFMADLALKLHATVILVSRNYLGSINHSLLTAEACKVRGLRVAGWIFNDHYMDYEGEIAQWSGLPSLASVPFREGPDAAFVREQALKMRPRLLEALDGLAAGR